MTEKELKDIEKKFMANLIAKRNSAALSQRDLAAKTGLTQQAISSMERLDRNPTLFNVIRYLSGLGIDINDLF